MTTTFNLRASNNATFQWTRDLSAFAAVYNLAAATIRMQARVSPYAPDPPAYEWASGNSAHGQVLFNSTTNLAVFVAPEADLARLAGDYVYDCRLEFSGGAAAVIFGGRLRVAEGVTRLTADLSGTGVSGLGDTVEVEGERGTSPVPLPLSPSAVLAACQAAAALTVSITATQIPSLTIPLNYFRTIGYASVGDGGDAIYVKGTSSGSMAVQDASGQWWALASTGQLSLKACGAKGDGISDDTSAILTWVAMAGPGVDLIAPVGVYKFTSPVVFPVISGITVRGAGRNVTRFVYAGTSTTIDLFTVGDGSTSITGISMTGFGFDSTTNMTSGAALHIKFQQNGSEFKDIAFGKLNVSEKLWDGIWFDNTNVTNHTNFEYGGVKNEAIVISGSATADTGSDLFLDLGTIVNAKIGIHCAGGFGGLYIGSVLVFGGANADVGFLQDNARVSRGNREIIISNRAVFDNTNSYGMCINDPLSNGAILNMEGFITGIGWSTHTIGTGIYVQSMPYGLVNIASLIIKDCYLHGIHVNDASTRVYVGDTAAIFRQGGYGVYCSVSTTNVRVKASMYDNTSGDIGGLSQEVIALATMLTPVSFSSSYDAWVATLPVYSGTGPAPVPSGEYYSNGGWPVKA